MYTCSDVRASGVIERYDKLKLELISNDGPNHKMKRLSVKSRQVLKPQKDKVKGFDGFKIYPLDREDVPWGPVHYSQGTLSRSPTPTGV